ncbi:MAG: HAD family hydrolase [Acidobacteria bacterium]|nr:MAG: HAD family hydrolase [Acidobacteriota bacterium]
MIVRVPDTTFVFFDVDFTLVHPGPRFQASGYYETCARHGLTVDAAKFDAAVAGAAAVLDSSDQLFNPQVYIDYTARIIQLMGGDPAGSEAPAREIYDDWAVDQHFSLYDDVDATLRELKARGLRLGLITNGHRSLASFQSHFELDGLISVTLSSREHGYMKPHPSIFRAALELARVRAEEAVMVGDSYTHDVLGAEQVGMTGVLIARGGEVPDDVTSPVIESLTELLPLVTPPQG